MFSTIHPEKLPSQSASNPQTNSQRQRKAASAPASVEGRDFKKPKKVNSELRKQQNRIASRNYREKRKQKLQLLEDMTRRKNKTAAEAENDDITEGVEHRYQYQYQRPFPERHMPSPDIYHNNEPANVHVANSQTTTGNSNSIIVPTNHFRPDYYTSGDSTPPNTSYPFSNSGSDSSAFSPIAASSTISYTPTPVMPPAFTQSFEPAWTMPQLYDNPPSTHIPHWQNPLPPPTSTWMQDMDFARPTTTRSSEDDYAFLTPTPPPPPPHQVLYSNYSHTPPHPHQQQQRVPYSNFTQMPTPPPPQQHQHIPYSNYTDDFPASPPSPQPSLQTPQTHQKQKHKKRPQAPILAYLNYDNTWDGQGRGISVEDGDSIHDGTNHSFERESHNSNSISLPSSPFFYPR